MSEVRGQARRIAVAAGTGLALVAATGVAHYSLADPAPPRPRPAVVEPLPAVEPLQLKPVAPSDARAINAAVPLATDTGPKAPPFHAVETAVDRSRAQDCLAAAAFFEAGDKEDDERAVAQVVLNRVRHPAFPKTICGVVFQGAERRTGCQFTFTCDGAMARRPPSPAAWRRARDVAAAALAGSVYAPVGLATHYHADWVVPYWSASLQRIAQIGPHIFYRWSGWWGKPAAYRDVARGAEPTVDVMASLSPSTAPDTLTVPTNDIAATQGRVRAVLSTASDDDMFMIRSTRGNGASDLLRARALCGTRDHCTVYGWADARLVARSLPLSPDQMDGLTFHYVVSAGTRPNARWNCARTPRANAAECMRPGLLATTIM